MTQVRGSTPETRHVSVFILSCRGVHLWTVSRPMNSGRSLLNNAQARGRPTNEWLAQPVAQTNSLWFLTVNEFIKVFNYYRHHKSPLFHTVIRIHLISLSCHILVFWPSHVIYYWANDIEQIHSNKFKQTKKSTPYYVSIVVTCCRHWFTVTIYRLRIAGIQF